MATAHLRGEAAVRLPAASVRRLLLLFGMYVVVPPQAYFELVEKVPGGYHAGHFGFIADYLKGG
ncbi:MAG: hypothetical protein IPH14_05220 [Thermomonas sp.]|uniref:hypothetical protein n=1 Tax=Thermomonas sp. TaxID=1971895 RepID=UPI0025F9D26A|nr:hypothetical protein [Thermomonas sp.]MBK6924668.1 hypothetical protein [Thermomonas sp.]